MTNWHPQWSSFLSICFYLYAFKFRNCHICRWLFLRLTYISGIPFREKCGQLTGPLCSFISLTDLSSIRISAPCMVGQLPHSGSSLVIQKRKSIDEKCLIQTFFFFSSSQFLLSSPSSVRVCDKVTHYCLIGVTLFHLMNYHFRRKKSYATFRLNKSKKHQWHK